MTTPRELTIGRSYPFRGTMVKILQASEAVGLFVEASEPIECELGDGGPRMPLRRFWIRERGRLEWRPGLRQVFAQTN